MIKPDERVLRAIESLRGNPNWEIVADWFRESLGQVFLEQGIFSQEMARYPFNSGRNAELREIINTIDRARKILEASKR